MVLHQGVRQQSDSESGAIERLILQQMYRYGILARDELTCSYCYNIFVA